MKNGGIRDGGSAHDENGQLVQTTEFDYAAVDREEPECDLAELTPEQLDGLKHAFRAVFAWIFQNGMKNPAGLTIRAIIACWVFLPELRPLTETEMAVGFGLKKQSLGRWVSHDPKCWKNVFPQLKIPHFREGKPRHEQDRNP